MLHRLDPLSLIFPRLCLLCGRTSRVRPVCSTCHPRQIHGTRCPCCHSPASPDQNCEVCRTFPPLFRQMRYLWEYEGATRHFIRFMKYRPSRRLCRYAGEAIAAAVPAWFQDCDWDLIVPVPSSRRQLQDRSFNQCILIARPLARALQLPLSVFALKRIDRRAPQASLPHEARLKNVRNSFIADPARVNGLRVLLVDDVVTTGATTAACISALRQAGAVSVDIVAAARAPAWPRFRSAVYRRFPPALFPAQRNVA